MEQLKPIRTTTQEFGKIGSTYSTLHSRTEQAAALAHIRRNRLSITPLGSRAISTTPIYSHGPGWFMEGE
jgi:hypothetical protein